MLLPYSFSLLPMFFFLSLSPLDEQVSLNLSFLNSPLICFYATSVIHFYRFQFTFSKLHQPSSLRINYFGFNNVYQAFVERNLLDCLLNVLILAFIKRRLTNPSAQTCQVMSCLIAHIIQK